MLTPGAQDACCSRVVQFSCRRFSDNNLRRNDAEKRLPPPRSAAPIRKFFRISVSTMLAIIVTAILTLIDFADAQGLNDPITQYIEGRLGNRKIYWCPSGYGYLAYCPQPTDWDNYTWCCTWPYMGSWKPSCCPFALPTGAVVAIIIASIVLVSLLIGLSCWCCFCCPLYKKLYEYEDDDDFEPLPPSAQPQQQRPYGYGPQ